MVALYNATDGANWRTDANWLSEEPLGTWHGVTTDDSGRVIELSLNANQLTGTIPAELGSLTNLTVLSLHNNQLSGTIPESLHDIAGIQDNLTELGLPRCHADLDALVKLYESTDGANWTSKGKWLSYAPFGDWHGIETNDDGRVSELDLHDNQLSGTIPSELGNLANLTALWLNNNQLSGTIPSELGNLANLNHLTFNNNQLSGAIPSELGNLANLDASVPQQQPVEWHDSV